MIRLIVLYYIFAEKNNKKKILLVIAALLLLLFSRQIFSGYDFSIVHLFGESLNILYGHYQLLDIDTFIMCDPVNSILRIFINPFFRKYIDTYSGDLVICVNETYYSTPGLGYSILNDIIYFPLYTFIILALLIIMILFLNKELKYIFSLLLISMLPHIMRLGMITAVSYCLSYMLWFILPLFFINSSVRGVLKK